MGKWAKVKDAKASGDKLPNLVAGDFQVKISNVKDVDGREGDTFYIIEMEVLKSSTDEVIVGRFYSYVIKYNIDMGPVNVKRFLLAAYGFDPQDPDNEDENFLREEGVLEADEGWEELVEMSLGEDQPIAGIVMNLSCVLETTKKKKQPFTKHTWFAAVEEDQIDED